MYKLEVLRTLKWFFESKNLSLANALIFRAQLSVESQKDLRLYYGQYFIGILSATEFLLDKKYPYNKEFKSTFIRHLFLIVILMQKRIIFI